MIKGNTWGASPVMGMLFWCKKAGYLLLNKKLTHRNDKEKELKNSAKVHCQERPVQTLERWTFNAIMTYDA